MFHLGRVGKGHKGVPDVGRRIGPKGFFFKGGFGEIIFG